MRGCRRTAQAFRLDHTISIILDEYGKQSKYEAANHRTSYSVPSSRRVLVHYYCRPHCLAVAGTTTTLAQGTIIQLWE
jgi:hypothetical protein